MAGRSLGMEWLKHFVITRDKDKGCIIVNGWKQGIRYSLCPFIGTWQEINYVNGHRCGIHRRWDVSGRLLDKYNYVKGKRDGTQRGWHLNGKLRYESYYMNKKLHGIQRGWHENGQPDYEDNFINGILHGIQQNWYFLRIFWFLKIQ